MMLSILIVSYVQCVLYITYTSDGDLLNSVFLI